MRSADKGMVKKARKEPWSSFDSAALLAFVIWGMVGLTFTLRHVTPQTVRTWTTIPELRVFFLLCLQNGDAILILLAAINTHLHAARQWGGSVARRWGAIIIVLAYAIETCGTMTGFPFGQYYYTDQFGPMLYLVPVTIPLAWHVVLTNALFVVRAVMPYLSPVTEAIMAGAICTIYDFILEPFATMQKHYWMWSGGTVPPLNYVAWFVVSALLIRLCAPTLSTRYRFDPRPALILGLTVAIFVAGELK